ncbi:DotH/IcmK family type IV secretion protein [Piscirickettsia salmonis]|uniref:DotH/IcmK family type IV secretion protein n=1 Tax=Piscirickettsia salmonis TaxID=1238 RepID=UPI00065F3870|nr:DotH/IcmK family type IV secretion protein [Piscirickettsia salmonis]
MDFFSKHLSSDYSRFVKKCRLAKLFTIIFFSVLGCSYGSLSDDSFNSIVNNNFPLTTDQIQKYKEIYNEQKKAKAAPSGNAPSESTSSIISESLHPGDIEPVIRTFKGMITSIVMTDQLGKVWPIISYSLGDPASFNIQWNKTSGVLMVQGLKDYGQANIGIMLKGLDIPVMLSLVLGQKKWDYLDYIRVQSYQSAADALAGTTPHAPSNLIQLLNGIPPQSAKELKVTGGSAQVWSYQGKYLLLTMGTLISPQWQAKQSSTGPSASNAYQLPAAPSLLISMNGVLHNITVADS